MELQHSWAIALRHIRLWTKDFNLIAVTLYWPCFDVLVWGFLGLWIQQTQGVSSVNYQTLCLFNILLWQAPSRGTVYIVTALLEEIWASNLINLFSLPLRIIEWIVGVIIFDMIITCGIMLYCIFFMFLLYQISILAALKVLLIFGPALLISAIWIGFATVAVIAQLGKRAQELAWILAWLFSPLCGVFYPLEVLPGWMQKISYCIPMTYIFEGLRQYLIHGINPAHHLVIAYVLSIIYALSAIGIFIWTFNRTKIKGLARLSD